MPRRGWRSITVSQSVYDYLWDEYSEKKDELALKEGITSFSGYVTRRLYEAIQESKKKGKKNVRPVDDQPH